MFHFWSNGLQGRAPGYGDPPPRTVIVLGFENEESERPEISVCRGLREPWPQFWRRLRSFG